MLQDVLLVIKNRLNEHLKSQLVSGGAEDLVVFLEGDKIDPVSFKLGAVTVLMINLEEENALRSADPYRQVHGDVAARVQPEIRLNLYILFVASFKQYHQSLRVLSMILQYFQRHRVLDRDEAPELAEGIEKLILEIVTLPFSEQAEIWSALRTTYHPSLLYKARMLAYLDEPTETLPRLETRILKTKQIDKEESKDPVDENEEWEERVLPVSSTTRE
ncbi:MAG: DUF4255 domain-containing protein [Acidobacteriota bacterium]